MAGEGPGRCYPWQAGRSMPRAQYPRYPAFQCQWEGRVLQEVGIPGASGEGSRDGDQAVAAPAGWQAVIWDIFHSRFDVDTPIPIIPYSSLPPILLTSWRGFDFCVIYSGAIQQKIKSGENHTEY